MGGEDDDGNCGGWVEGEGGGWFCMLMIQEREGFCRMQELG